MHTEKEKGFNVAAERLADIGRTVRVSVPAEVAFNFDKMNKVTATVLGRLGCPACHSGFDIRFMIERDFVVNAKLEVIGAGHIGQ